MKKLFLTSFSFKGADDNIHKDYRIVMVESNEVPEGKPFESVAYTKMQRWFPDNHGPSCELQSIRAFETITGYAEDNVIRNENKKAFEPVDDREINWDNVEEMTKKLKSMTDNFVAANFECEELEKEIERLKENKVMDASWSDSKSHPPDTGDGFSDDVLIDTTGFRKVFIVGWYDFDEKKWVSPHDGPEINQENLKWQYLPLAKYDKS